MKKKPECDCGSMGSNVYSEIYDAWYCSNCNAWLSSDCGDPACEYCRDRPEKPLNDKGELICI